jgi:hypothetical protein
MSSAVCLLTSYTSTYAAFAALSVPHMKEYAGRHRYEIRVIQREDCERKGSWIKIEPIRAGARSRFRFCVLD